MLEIWYRYSGYTYDDATTHIMAEPFTVLRHTPAGVVLDVYGEEKFVLNVAKRRWAYPDKRDALHSFMKRKQHHLMHIANAHDRIAPQYAEAQRMLEAGVLDTPQESGTLWPGI